MPNHIFISHATADDAFVADLRRALEDHGLPVWVDSRNLRGGANLNPEIEQAVREARAFIAVLSLNAVNSTWVREETRLAQQVEQERTDDGYRAIPLLLPGIEPTALGLWFTAEPLAIPIALKPGGLSEALPRILAALGERAPDDVQPQIEVAAPPVAELLLKLTDPHVVEADGTQRAAATATLVYEPAGAGERSVESTRFRVTAPLGPIELEEVRWYLEKYHLWPVGVFRERAERTEAQLPAWGQALYAATLGTDAGRAALTAWQQATGARRFSVLVDSDLPEGSPAEEQAAAHAAASDLLALPWELLHDGGGYLFQGQHATRVRRRLPDRRPHAEVALDLPIRVLLVSPRPEDAHTGYFDHRASALPLVQAVEELGDLVALTVLPTPTFAALEQALQDAAAAETPFDVVHFDGHGVYDRVHGLGALCFEDPNDQAKLSGRAMKLVRADTLAAVLRDYRIPLVFLDACQTATVAADPTASVAARLLSEGVTSVVAMSHSVLVETARRFVAAFYRELAQGARVGQAMLAGQQALFGDTRRGRVMGAGALELQDWFVPVLYQERLDPQLVTARPAREATQTAQTPRQRRFGALPPEPEHRFVGRSRALLALERLLHTQPYAVVRGPGGAGKTALASELARWLVRSGRVRRAAFVSLETTTDARGVLDRLGRQLLPEGDGWSVAHYRDLNAALQPVERALRDDATLIVLDNLESVLPDATGQTLAEAAGPLDDLFVLCQKLLAADPATRLVFTSREHPPAPFDQRGRVVELGALARDEAVQLVSAVMEQQGWTPAASDPGRDPEEITALVEAVDCHVRALVLLAREVARRGVRATTADLQGLMADLHKRSPDNRENSLYASVELSLRRLPDAMRAQIRALGVFHGGFNLAVLAFVLDSDIDKASELGEALVDVGLGTEMGYGYLRLDPALPPYLRGQHAADEAAQVQERWVEAMRQLLICLYNEAFKDTQTAFSLTLLELPNLLALLAWAAEHWSPERVVDVASQLEQLIVPLGRSQALVQATAVREWAAQRLGEWSHAQFTAASADIDQMQKRDLRAAHAAAQELLQRSLAAGEDAFPEAAYDIAMAHIQLGRVLRLGGAAPKALKPLGEACRRFAMLTAAGNTSAERMASIARTEQADCLAALDQLEEATTAYETTIAQAEQHNDKRSVAVGQFQLGTVRKNQGRYADALRIYEAARETFAALDEPLSVATAWHQIGIVHQDTRQYDQAEAAYRQALALRVLWGDRAGEADSLDVLGILYGRMRRLEEAANFCRQAVDISVELQDHFSEGKRRSSLAVCLIALQRYDEARRELQLAIMYNELYSHTARPWNTWMILHNLEQVEGNSAAAQAARARAIAAYLAHRRDGGESQLTGAQWCAVVLQVIEQEEMAKAEEDLAKTLAETEAESLKTLGAKLRAILRGSRDPALAQDPALWYQDAVELMLLLEVLSAED